MTGDAAAGVIDESVALETAPRVLRRNPTLVAHPFDSEAREPMMVCEVSSSGGGVARFAVPLRLYALLERFDGRADTAAVLRRASEDLPGLTYGEADLTRFVDQFLVQRGLLVPASDDAPATTPAPQRPSSMLYLKFPLLPARAVTAVTRPLTWLYAPAIAWPLLAAILAAHVVFYRWVLPTHPLPFGALTGGELLAVMLVVGASTLSHELGHATAAVRGGCRRTTIGCGLYLYMIVGYADLSEVWRLPRRQRLLADVGGVYFQGLFVSALLPVYWATGWKPALFAIPLADIAMAMSTNPFLRLDGYWVVSDLAGIANLRERSQRLLMDAWRKLWGARTGTTAAREAWPMPRAATTVLTIYAILSTFFFGYLAVRLSQFLIWNLLHDYPQRLLMLPRDALRQPFSVTHMLGDLLSVAIRTLVLFGMLRFAYALCAGGVRFVRAALDARRSRRGDTHPRHGEAHEPHRSAVVSSLIVPPAAGRQPADSPAHR